MIDQGDAPKQVQPTTTKQVNTDSPRDKLELALYRIFKSVLVEDKIGIKDRFDDLGGTSISAIKIIARVNKQFRVKFSMDTLIKFPTIEALGGLIRSGEAYTSEYEHVTHLTDEKPGKVVVCVHPAGGTSFCYLSLAKLFHSDEVSVFGLQSKGVNPGEDFLPSITELAQYHLAALKPVLARTHVLVGASYGGLVAYEMGRLLGEEGLPSKVVMLDTLSRDDPSFFEHTEPVSLEVFREKMITYNGMFPGIKDEQIVQFFKLYNHHRATQRSYTCLPNKNACVLVQALDQPEAVREMSLASWQNAAGPHLRGLTCSGDHSTLLEQPAVGEIADIIKSLL